MRRSLQWRCGALMSRPDHCIRVLGCAVKFVPHLAYAIRRESEYPSRPKLHERLKYIETLATRGRHPVAQEILWREVTDPIIFALLSNGKAQTEKALSPLSRRLSPPDIGRLA